MSHNFDQLDEMLLDEFNKAGLIESSTIKLYKSKKKLDETISLNENKASAISPDEFEIRGVVVNGEQFARVYQDYESYPNIDAIMTAVGLPPALFSDISYDSFKRQFRRLRAHFRENRRYGHVFDVDVDDRKKYYYEARDAVPTASRDGIDPGKKNRKTNTTKVVNVLNGKEVVPGEFYTDISRIPKRKWGNWIKFWERQVSRIKNPTSILGRVWRKVFIMGYQFSRGVVVEIWYNSATSDFSVYDQNGAELGRPAASMQEAVRLFVTFLLKQYESDNDVFGGNMNDLARSYHGALARGATRDAIEADREAKLAGLEKKSPDKPLHSVGRTMSMGDEENKQKHKNADANREAWNKAKGAAFNRFSDAVKRGSKKASDKASEFQQKQQQKRDEFNQRQKQEYEQRTGRKSQTYDHDDGSYVGQDREQPSPIPSLPNLSYSDLRDKAPEYTSEEQLNAIWRSYRDAYADAKKAHEKYEKTKEKYENGDSYTSKEDMNKTRQALEKAAKNASRVLKRINSGEPRPTGKNKNERDDGMNKQQNESFVFENEEVDDIISDLDFNPASQEMDRAAISRRKMAAQSGFTTTAIRTSAYEEMLSVYHETRVNPQQAGVIGRFLMNTLSIFRGRKDKINLPTKKANAFDRLRMSIIGTMYRADFVIGFSLKDAINVEVWYVTEPDPSKGAMDATVSSFYVYDVTAKKVIRSNLPYYRSALGVVFAKLTLSDEEPDLKKEKGKKSAEELNHWSRWNSSQGRG